MDALDFVRGLRPWSQFYNYVVAVALIDGSQLWADQHSNERYLPEVEKRLKEQKRESHRPQLVGYSRLVKAIDELTDHVYMHRAEDGQWDQVSPRPKPRFLVDLIDERRVVKSRARIDAILDEAHQTVKGGDRSD